ncbi:MAG: UDP-N-acetylglucosamine 1-carboxyvinyltransferase, partial [Myxococcales bacterium]|nr:UDP-N-acetylglucosamine 1-carboxyvinyltransferase [Myxococcales bacterium]
MDYFEIEGGSTISGHLVPGGNKNEALPVLAATLLTDQPILLKNLPQIRDVAVMLEILESMGATVSRDGSSARIDNSGLRDVGLPEALCRRIRSSILFAGPMLARFHRVVLPPPGGDVIGRRRTDT